MDENEVADIPQLAILEAKIKTEPLEDSPDDRNPLEKSLEEEYPTEEPSDELMIDENRKTANVSQEEEEETLHTEMGVESRDLVINLSEDVDLKEKSDEEEMQVEDDHDVTNEQVGTGPALETNNTKHEMESRMIVEIAKTQRVENRRETEVSTHLENAAGPENPALEEEVSAELVETGPKSPAPVDVTDERVEEGYKSPALDEGEVSAEQVETGPKSPAPLDVTDERFEEGSKSPALEEGEVSAERVETGPNSPAPVDVTEGQAEERSKSPAPEEIFLNCQHCMSAFISKRSLGKHLKEHLKVKKVKFPKSSLPLKKRGRHLEKNKVAKVPLKDSRSSLQENAKKFSRQGKAKKKISLDQNTSTSSVYGRGKRAIKAKDWDDYIIGDLEKFVRKPEAVEDEIVVAPTVTEVARSFDRGRPRRGDHSPPVFDCHICGKILKNAQNLRTHNLCHSSEKPHRCDICKKSYSRITVLKKHINEVHADPETRFIYKCEICDKRLTTSQALRHHVALHMDDKCYPCDDCGMSFVTPGRLRYHLLTHQRRSFTCDFCKNQFLMKSHLQGHIFECHFDQRPYECDVCHRKFARKNFYRIHRQRHIDEEPKQECNFCDETFHGPLPMYIHAYKTHFFNHKLCYICQGEFGSAEETAEHHLALHHSVRPKCPNCRKTFASEESLLKHACKRKDSLVYYCTCCPKTFVNKALLRVHKLAQHSKKKSANKFKCGICELSFAKERQLICHEKHHYEEMKLEKYEAAKRLLRGPKLEEVIGKFCCENCDARFETENELHLHGDECFPWAQVEVPPEFPCPNCPKMFIGKFYLEKHLAKCVAGIQTETNK